MMNKYVNLDGDYSVSTCPYCGSDVALASVFLCTTHDEVLEIGTSQGVWHGYRDGWYVNDDGNEIRDGEPGERTCEPSVTLDLHCPRCPESVYLHIPLVKRGYEHVELDSDNDTPWWITKQDGSRDGPIPSEIEALRRRQSLLRRLRQGEDDPSPTAAQEMPVAQSGWYVNVVRDSDGEISWREGPHATKAEADATAKYMRTRLRDGASLCLTVTEDDGTD